MDIKMIKHNFDYTSTMMMKMFLARPSENGSEVLISFEQALRLIKKTDEITQHQPKVIYLVGWQYNGHDDRYPDIYEVNEALKRPCDSTAYDSLLWLIFEARKYNTVVSLHINFADAYEDAELFSKLVSANALIRDKDGKVFPVESYNGKNCYKISYKEYWESGLFKSHFDRFLDIFPVIRQQKTIHVDNFQCYFNNSPDIHVREMQEYRNKMIDYVSSCGIDITSEGVYRECEAGRESFNCNVPKELMLSSPVATLDRIPALWWLSPYGDNDYLNIPFDRLCGGIPGDEYYDVFYGNTHGEDIWLEHGCEDGAWESTFIEKFACELVPYRYLCTKKCVRIETTDSYKTAFFDDGTSSDGRTATITTADGKILKCATDVAMPVAFMKNTFIFYSKHCTELSAYVGNAVSAELYEVTADGNKPEGSSKAENGLLTVKLHPGECIIAECRFESDQ